ncbi:MBL fold metallo-hydrolase [Aliiroseovarius sp. S1123]|uniref:MBL fold metallo-hydrolase n=1 Tax=unclassified Aliiroseovarius TaxID=2623558 RepID=UPI001FF32AB3|nr:MBL fold metallo-hydrolase [Aliiroseovarius sp. S1123]MCK0170485.1 MBL fold metallo-hydrolase [Aliiroseovarius sp. S1123]
MVSEPKDRPAAGIMQQLEPGIRRIIAPNPSPMTYWGTNTFVLGEGDVAVIDPGPADATHMQAILDGLAPGERISQILVTHAHLDHSPLARSLSESTGAPILAFGDAMAGRSAVMHDLVARGLSSGGEGVDASFTCDITLSDGEVFTAGGLQIETIWTPGHFANHISFAVQDIVFTGDHIMEWASSLVSPPDGDLTAFMASCRKLAARQDRVFYPAHGDRIDAPAARLSWLINHRLTREAEILATLTRLENATISALTREIYTETPAALIPAAERNVFAHLIDLATREIVTATPQLEANAIFRMKGEKI